METTLKYGTSGVLALNVPEGALIAECGRPLHEPLDDPAAALSAALLDPLGFPPIASAVVPGDRVAIPLDAGLPQASALVAGLVQALCAAKIDPSDISVIRTPEDAALGREDPRSGLAEEVGAQVQLIEHDPGDRDGLGYLGVSSENKPIYLNRAIQDADVVLPIGCLRVDAAVAYHGIHSVLFPTYSDAEALKRYRAPSNEDSEVQRRRRREEANEVAWLVGVIATIQVVPGAGDTILHVVAGAPDAIVERGRDLCETAWQYRVPRRAKLVVAGIEGDAACQTWENVARAVTSAMSALEDDGAIAICSDLATEPGEALRRLASADDFDTAIHEVRRERSADAVAASQLLRAMDQARVYLLSRLNDDVVEEIGLAPVSEEADIARLSSRFESCIVLSNAQYAQATSAD